MSVDWLLCHCGLQCQHIKAGYLYITEYMRLAWDMVVSVTMVSFKSMYICHWKEYRDFGSFL